MIEAIRQEGPPCYAGDGGKSMSRELEMRRNNFWLFSGDTIRAMFSGVMSEMYKTEVPQYRALMQLVADVNTELPSGWPNPIPAIWAGSAISR